MTSHRFLLWVNLLANFNVPFLGIIGANQTDYGMNKQLENDIYDWILNRTTKLYVPPNIRFNKTVFFNADLYQILEVNEIQGFVTVKIFVNFAYYLDGMNWTQPFPESPTDSLYLPGGTLWIPDLVFINAIKVKVAKQEQYITSEGLVLALGTAMVVKCSCGFNMRHFPFDKQVIFASIRSMFKHFKEPKYGS